MRIRVVLDEKTLRAQGLVPITTFNVGGAEYQAAELAAWHGGAMTMLANALKGSFDDQLHELQLADQLEAHHFAQLAWMHAAKGGDAGEAVRASERALEGVGAGYTLPRAIAASDGPGWPGRPGQLRVSATWSDAAKALIEQNVGG